MERPAGVTVLAILDFIGAGFWALMAIAGFVGASFIGAIISKAATQSGPGVGAGLGAAIGAVIGVMGLVGCAIAALIGWGMWSLKEWARIVQIVFAGIGAFFQAIGILTSLMHIQIFGLMWNLVWLAVNAYIIYYLIQPQVKAAFAARPIASYTPPVPPAPPTAGAGM